MALSTVIGQKAGIVLMLLTACGFSGWSLVWHCLQVLVNMQVLSWCNLLTVFLCVVLSAGMPIGLKAGIVLM